MFCCGCVSDKNLAAENVGKRPTYGSLRCPAARVFSFSPLSWARHGSAPSPLQVRAVFRLVARLALASRRLLLINRVFYCSAQVDSVVHSLRCTFNCNDGGFHS